MILTNYLRIEDYKNYFNHSFIYSDESLIDISIQEGEKITYLLPTDVYNLFYAIPSRKEKLIYAKKNDIDDGTHII